ncbi:MAG TPA: 2-dehydro-3-deoxy-6-phosphogalactonate aldolase [Caulobacteraceae bacterium]
MNFEEALAESGVVAIIRSVTPAEVLKVGEALHQAGVRVVEVPLNSPDPYDSIDRLATEFKGRLFVGGGTILTQTEADAVAAAGGRLMVSPNTDPHVIRRAAAMGMIPFPGFATASEAFVAIEAGARHLKLFPASTYGPGHLKALKAVLPKDVAIAPVGGVGAAEMAEWRKAGAACFGIGGELYKPGMAPDEIHRRAVELVQAEKAARSDR